MYIQAKSLTSKRTQSNSTAAHSTVSVRSLLIGALLCALIAAAGPYADSFIKGSSLALTNLPVAAAVLLFVLVLGVNVILRRFGNRLRKEELITIFIMMLVACTIPTMGLTEQLLPIIASVGYFASPENEWAELIAAHTPKWLVPQDPEALRRFFEGSPEGAGIPWSAWAVPLTAWLAFIAALYAVMFAMMVMLRKQWMEKERLMYPLMQLPTEMMETPPEGAWVNKFFKNKLLWVGFAVPVVIGLVNGLHAYFHFIPRVPLEHHVLLLRDNVGLRLEFSYPVMGISYLLATDVSLGLWLFAVLGTFQTGIFRMVGYSLGPREAYCASGPAVSHQGFGAMIVFAVIILWSARRHLASVFRKAFTGDPAIDDSDEIVSYRTAVILVVGGLLFIMTWLCATNLPLPAVLLLMGSAFVIFLTLTRIIAQGGVMVIKSPLTPQVMSITALGSKFFGASGMAGLAYSFVWCADLKVFLMVQIAHVLKLGEAMRANRRRITLAVCIAITVTLGVSIYAVMHLSYTHGGLNLDQWYYLGGSRVPFRYIADKISHPVDTSGVRLMFVGIGAAVMAGLVFLRNNFLWWPIHHLGFAVGNTLPMANVWFSVFLAWLVKVLVLKYGGPRIFKTTRFFFLGLVLGQFVIAGVWLLVDLVTGMRGNVIYRY